MPTTHMRDEPSIDRWVQTSLRQRYAAILLEPVPDSLLRLLRDDTAPSSE